MTALTAAALAEATAAWPGVTVDRDAFAHYLAEREGDRVTDLVLAFACTQGDAHAITHFNAELEAAVALGVRAIGGDHALQTEVAQRLRERVLVGTADRPARVTSYTGRGPLRGWLRVIATRDAIDLRRRADKIVPISDEAMARLPSAEHDPELQFIKAGARAAFRDAFRAAFAALEPLERDLIRRHHLGGETVDALATRHGIHRATAARWVARARERLFEATRARLAVAPEEVDSILRLAESRLELSLRSQL